MPDQMPDPRNAVDAAIIGRRSIRAFLPEPVSRDLVEHLLAVAARAPSGTNMQPWQAIVLTGDALTQFCDRIEALSLSEAPVKPQYAYYPPQFREPYLARRRKVGWDLYGSLGIVKGDNAAMKRQHARNFRFFGAPVGLICTIDADLELGSWLDYGMFLQNFMIAARAAGLDTCPQAAFATYHEEIRATLAIPPERSIVCGIALGHADMAAPENRFATEREPVAAFTRFLDRLPE